MKTRVIAAGCVTALAVAGCGGGQRSLSSQVSAELVVAVGRINASAQSRDVAATTAELADLRKSVLVLRSHDDLTAATAQRILNAADVVQSDLALITPSPSTTGTTNTTSSTSATTTSTTTPAPGPGPTPPGKKHHGRGNGDG